jgi:hypothetical protein
MGKGISWRQQVMLNSILEQERRFSREGEGPEPIAWRDIDDGPRFDDIDIDARVAWNREQTLRRSLRSLERRGLVALGRYVFFPEPIITAFGNTSIVWTATYPDNHVPGDTRIMTGARLTDAGRAHARKGAYPKEASGRRARGRASGG